MSQHPDVTDLAAALRASIGLLLRRMRQTRPDDELSLPESSALTRLDRNGPATASALARLEQISPQSMGATLSALEGRGLVQRAADPQDGRRIVLSLTDSRAADAAGQAQRAHRAAGPGPAGLLHPARTGRAGRRRPPPGAPSPEHLTRHPCATFVIKRLVSLERQQSMRLFCRLRG